MDQPAFAANTAVLGGRASGHAEQDQRAGPGRGDRNFRQEALGGIGQHFFAARFAPVAGVGRRRHWLGPVQIAPDAAREAKAIATGAKNTGLMHIGGAEPDPRGGDHPFSRCAGHRGCPVLPSPRLG